jgi:SIR2-like protein
LRFIEGGPDIPDELLFAQDDGNVVFFCGSGVSRAKAGLPNFSDLTEKVIDGLGEAGNSKANQLFSTYKHANQDPLTRGHISADQIFGALTRSFDAKDIERAVAQTLVIEEAPDLSAHKTILKLARLRSGETRLITTNFDLLFEKASSKKTKSVTRSSLPRIQYSNNDWGIVHLHGKVNPNYSGSDHDGFVLSSYEFGDAYLAQGWARDFIKDVLEKFVAVFIGFSADDPPIRYLLEGLQQNNVAEQRIYAFQETDDEAIAQWNEKGVNSIEYELDKDNSHNALWLTLEAWAKRTENPDTWKDRILAKAVKGPIKLKPHERGMVAHLVKTNAGAKAFERKKPVLPAEWLCVFDPLIRLQQPKKARYSYSEGEKVTNPHQLYGLDSDPPPSDRNETYNNKTTINAWDAFSLNGADYKEVNNNRYRQELDYNPFMPSLRGGVAHQPANLPKRIFSILMWIVNVSDQPITVWWAGRQNGLHPQLIQQVESEIYRNKGKNISETMLKEWNSIFELSHFYHREEYPEFRLQDRIKVSGWNNSIVREYSRVSAPFLKNGNSNRHYIPRGNIRKETQYSLVDIDTGYPEHLHDIEIPDEYLSMIVDVLRKNLELAIELEQSLIGWYDDIPSFSLKQGDQTDRVMSGTLHAYMVNFSKLFLKLHEYDLGQAKSEFRKWRSDGRLFTRLRIWACSLNGLVSTETFVQEILSLDSEHFWIYRGEKDLLFSLRNNWNNLSNEQKEQLEKKILEKPPRYYKETNKEYKTRAANNQLDRFYWLEKQGCGFTSSLNKITTNLKKKSPGWKPEYAEKIAEENRSRNGLVRTVTNCENLKTLPISKIIEEASKKGKRDFSDLVEYAPFLGLCDDMPLRAISALTQDLKKGNFSLGFWKSFLQRDCRKTDRYRLKQLIAGRLTQIPSENFSQIMLAASCWFEDNGPLLRDKNVKLFEALWLKFIKTMSHDVTASSSGLVREHEKEINWSGEAINSAAGNLAELHMIDPAKNNLKTGQGFPKEWLYTAEQLLKLPEDYHRYVMVIFNFNLNWFYQIDPEWTQSNLLKIIENDTSSKTDVEAFWAGFMWGATVPNAVLYTILKPHFLRMTKDRSIEGKRHLEVLSGVLLSGWGSRNDSNKDRYVTDEELRSVLLNAREDYRVHTLLYLDRWNKEAKDRWQSQTLDFLKNVWPKHKKIRTAKISAQLVEIAFNQTDNFSEISHQVVQLVSKISDEHIRIPAIRKLVKDEEDEIGEGLVVKNSEDFLNLLHVILSDSPQKWPYGTIDFIKSIENNTPKLSNDWRLIELKSKWNDLM